MGEAKLNAKQLQAIIDQQKETIEALTDQLDLERKSIRLPSVMTVKMFNTMVDFLNSVKPAPETIKDVPERKPELAEVIDTESASHVN